MAERITCYVTQVLPEGAAFAVREDNNESIYISASLNKELELEPTDVLAAVIVPNIRMPERTPWFMLTASLLEDEA